jgi:hypothetical protein
VLGELGDKTLSVTDQRQNGPKVSALRPSAMSITAMIPNGVIRRLDVQRAASYDLDQTTL